MDLNNTKYIILELIPTSLNPEKGLIIQLSALKLEGLKLLDRFDYRLKEELNPYPQMLEMFSYDKDSFTYKDTKEEILNDFTKWAEDLPLLILDNQYTPKYFASLSNQQESILKYLNEEYQDDIIEKIINKYNLEPSNYIVDLLYEALIKEL